VTRLAATAAGVASRLFEEEELYGPIIGQPSDGGVQRGWIPEGGKWALGMPTAEGFDGAGFVGVIKFSDHHPADQFGERLVIVHELILTDTRAKAAARERRARESVERLRAEQRRDAPPAPVPSVSVPERGASRPGQPQPAPEPPTVPIEKVSDEEMFVHTVRAGVVERAELSRILFDSAERCRMIPRFGVLFSGWAETLLASCEKSGDTVADVELTAHGFGWRWRPERTALHHFLQLARDRQSQPLPSLNALVRAAELTAYGRDGEPMPVTEPPPEPERVGRNRPNVRVF
jgi:hypothetical protein